MKNIFKKLILAGLVTTLALPCNAKNLVTVVYNNEPTDLVVKEVNNNVLIPLKGISAYLGYEVKWDNQKKQIDIINGNEQVTLVIGSYVAKVNGKEMQLKVPAQIIGGTTYVPLRFVGEALDLTVDFNSKTQIINLEGKYTLDRKSKKLLMRTEKGKKAIAEIKTLHEYYDLETVYTNITKNGSEIVCVYQMIQGAAGEGSSDTTFYIKDNKIIDKVENNFMYLGGNTIAEKDDQVIICKGRYIKIYDDQTGNLLQKYDLNTYQEGLSLDLMKITENYIMGRCGDTIHVVDLKTKKVTRILDLIPEEDREFVYDPSMYLMQDQIDLVWETDNALVFKYYSITEEKEKTVTCKLG